MKKNLLLLAFVGILFAFAPAADVYKVDLSKSKIEWIGAKVTGKHNGEIKLASGVLNAKGNKLDGGNFEMDMTSMTCIDLDASNGNKLLGHLKSDDFFSVEKNPTSKFVITKVQNTGVDKATITGNLTIKGITNAISFPASIKQKDGVLVAVANGVKINRTKFDIKYGSKSFIDGLGDKAIDDEFTLNITLLAKK
ncbi:YceI family protein [Pedobacter alpinus]|uniref:YceI family protein n=1 Tax=Pedobacter alpinus TaxID=1590643 RepID=A0ABW5TQC6_9SPHI